MTLPSTRDPQDTNSGNTDQLRWKADSRVAAGQKLKILEEDIVREGTVKFRVALPPPRGVKRSPEEVRVVVYPDKHMQVMGDPGTHFLQSDLSDAQQTQLLSRYDKLIK